MKKLSLCLLAILIFIVLSVNVYAQAQQADKVSLAYQCLKDRISEKDNPTISLQESFFGVLALGTNSKLESKIESEKSSGSCWPSPTCSLKDTAQALLAYSRLGKNTADIERYLISTNGSTNALNWFLLIDVEGHGASSCAVSYSSNQASVSIGEDMKLSITNGGACLSLAPESYWLKIASSDSCLNEKYDISCDKDFITSLLYTKSGESTIYVSSQTHSASSSGTTTEKVNARCFKEGGECNYEGSLWSALALRKKGHDISSFIPYLVALSSNNGNLLPSSIIYSLTSGEDHYSSLVQSQISSKYWQAPSTSYNKFYDTALALLALQNRQSLEKDNAKAYLFSVQTPNGCWNNDNIRDTAFLLYAGWPESQATPVIPGVPESCTSAGYFCQSFIDCKEAGGITYSSYDCPGLLECCSVRVIQKTCSEKNGRVCNSGETCSGTEVGSSEGSCCIGTCTETASQETQCERNGGLCFSSCDSATEQETSDSCNSATKVCCVQKTSKSTSGLGIWITILLILIALAILAIVFRHKLQLMIFKFRKKGGISSSPMIMRRPPFPPMMPSRQPMPRPRQQQAMPQRKSPLDKEMEETLRKLREISK